MIIANMLMRKRRFCCESVPKMRRSTVKGSDTRGLKRGAVRRAAEAEQKECKDEGGLKGMAVPSH